jgi:hypothetical protein
MNESIQERLEENPSLHRFEGLVLAFFLISIVVSAAVFLVID